jgi:CRP-like cAMP-binding protein
MLHGVKQPALPNGNLLLSSLPKEEWDFFRPHLEPASLPAGFIYADFDEPITHCFFPTNGMISLLTVSEDGVACEVGWVGFEGMIGVSATLGRNHMPYQTLVQVKTDGYKIPHRFVRELFRRNGTFHDVLLRVIFVLLQHVAQTSACNHFHSIQERMCRWFATMSERSGDRHLRLTQEFLSHMLGVQRTSIATVAGTMQAEGIISYTRGKIEVVDMERLEACSCECLRVMRDVLRTFTDEEKNRVVSDTRQTNVPR